MFYRRIDEHLCLKLVSTLDAEAVYAMIERNRDDLARWFVWVPDMTLDGERTYLAQVSGQWAQLSELCTIIELDGEPVGTIGLHRIDRTVKTCEIGYWLDAAHRGHGIITKATREIERLCFEDLGMNRIGIHADVRNERSRAVPERLGYRFEGVLRAKLAGADGAPQDEAVYSLLREEWLARDGGGTTAETTE